MTYDNGILGDENTIDDAASFLYDSRQTREWRTETQALVDNTEQVWKLLQGLEVTDVIGTYEVGV